MKEVTQWLAGPNILTSQREMLKKHLIGPIKFPPIEVWEVETLWETKANVVPAGVSHKLLWWSSGIGRKHPTMGRVELSHNFHHSSCLTVTPGSTERSTSGTSTVMEVFQWQLSIIQRYTQFVKKGCIHTRIAVWDQEKHQENKLVDTWATQPVLRQER